MKWFFWVVFLALSCKTQPDRSFSAATAPQDDVTVGGWRSCSKDVRQDITLCVLDGDRIRVCIRDLCATTARSSR